MYYQKCWLTRSQVEKVRDLQSRGESHVNNNRKMRDYIMGLPIEIRKMKKFLTYDYFQDVLKRSNWNPSEFMDIVKRDVAHDKAKAKNIYKGAPPVIQKLF